MSHLYGVMVFNPKGTLEGEWTDSVTGADFSIDGQCKSGPGGYGCNTWLVRSNAVVTKKQTTQSTSQPVSAVTTQPSSTTIIGNLKNLLNNPMWSL